MSSGIIASRYAKALLMLVDETHGGDLVVRQVQALQDALSSVPELQRAIDDPQAVPAEKKMALLEAVITGGSPSGAVMAPELKQFIGLLARNGRISECKFVFSSFISMYYKSRGVIRGRLVLPSAEEADPRNGLVDRIRNLVESRTGKTFLLTTELDTGLIGGFVLEIEDQLLDASVAHQLDIIRRQFIERNRRIV